jgi:ABC-type branched-subunit amino acid transport system permease subunit
LTFIPECLLFLGVSESIAGPFRMVMYGILLIIILRVRPRGLWGVK